MKEAKWGDGQVISPPGNGLREETAPVPHFGYFDAGAAASLACALHSERNFLRSLPCRPLASASFEHSIEAALCGLVLLLVAAGAAGAGEAAGEGVCAKAEPASRSEAARARPAAREEIVIMRYLRGKE